MMDPGQKLQATNSEGGTADEIYLKGIHAVVSHSLPPAAGEVAGVEVGP